MNGASLGRRFAALSIDWILCLLIAGWFGPLHASAWPLIVLVVEYTFFTGLFKRTPGMYLTGIRCVVFIDGSRLGVPRAAVRAVLLALVIPALVMDSDRRGLHDRIAGSVVAEASAVIA